MGKVALKIMFIHMEMGVRRQRITGPMYRTRNRADLRKCREELVKI